MKFRGLLFFCAKKREKTDFRIVVLIFFSGFYAGQVFRSGIFRRGHPKKQRRLFNQVNFRVIHYADVLLMYSEALNELNQTADAYQYVNKVRQKSNLTPLPTAYPGIGNNKTLYAERLKIERALELCGEGVRGPDPWVIRKGEYYYYMNTQDNKISIHKTKALSQLARAEVKIVYNAPAAAADSQNIWVPELHFLNNKWYIYYTAGSSGDLSTQRMFVLENSDADPTKGTWAAKGQIKDNTADFFAIDATVFSKEGKNYIIWSGHISAADNTQRLYISALADDAWKMAGPRVEISVPQYDWEKIGTPHVNEGPEILMNKKGNVFLIFSASGCWTDDYSLGTEDRIIYHSNPGVGLACSNDRSPRMQKFSWNIDGTPNFGEPVKIGVAITKPSGE